MKTILFGFALSLLLATYAFADVRTVALVSNALNLSNSEITTARSGQYQKYRASTVASLLSEIKRIIVDAKISTKSNVTADLIDVAAKRIDEEIYQANRLDFYWPMTVAIFLHQLNADLQLAIKYDAPGSCVQ